MKFRPEDFLIALEEARRLLKEMPFAEVPHSLKKTRVSSSRKLTPVEARALYRELDRDEDFRRATLENWNAPSLGSADARVAAAVLFLERSNDWESLVQGHLAEVELEEARMETGRLERCLCEAQAQVKALKVQVAEARRLAEEETKRRTDQLGQDLGRARERIGGLAKKLAEEKRKVEYWDKEAQAAWRELDEADRRYDDLRERYSSKMKPGLVQTGVDTGGETGFSRDPLQAARMLDQMVSFWEVGLDSGPDPVSAFDPLEFPPGLDPKSGGAVMWLYYDAPRLTLLVDGYNVAHYWHYHRQIREKPDHQTIEFITNKLDKLARYSVGRHRVNFYLDSRYANGLEPDWDNRFKSGHLNGFYVVDADDGIAEEATRRAGEPVAVITSDNALADRCRQPGAVRLFSEALAEWLANSPV